MSDFQYGYEQGQRVECRIETATGWKWIPGKVHDIRDNALVVALDENADLGFTAGAKYWARGPDDVRQAWAGDGGRVDDATPEKKPKHGIEQGQRWVFHKAPDDPNDDSIVVKVDDEEGTVHALVRPDSEAVRRWEIEDFQAAHPHLREEAAKHEPFAEIKELAKSLAPAPDAEPLMVSERVEGVCTSQLSRLAAFVVEHYSEDFAGIDPDDSEELVDVVIGIINQGPVGRLKKRVYELEAQVADEKDRRGEILAEERATMTRLTIEAEKRAKEALAKVATIRDEALKDDAYGHGRLAAYLAEHHPHELNGRESAGVTAIRLLEKLWKNITEDAGADLGALEDGVAFQFQTKRAERAEELALALALKLHDAGAL